MFVIRVSRDFIRFLSRQIVKQLTGIDGGFVDISHGGRFDNIPNDEFLDGLVLRHTSGAVGASDSLHVATAVLGASSITAFASLKTKLRSLQATCSLELTSITRVNEDVHVNYSIKSILNST